MSDSAVIADRVVSGAIFEVSVKQSIAGVGSLGRYQISVHDPTPLASLTAKVLQTNETEPDLKLHYAALEPGTVLDLTPPEVKPPVVDEAKNAFLADLGALRRATRIAADGLVVKDAEDVDAIRARLQAALDATPAYRDLL